MIKVRKDYLVFLTIYIDNLEIDDYPKDVQYLYGILCEDLSKSMKEDLDRLLDMVYKTAYMDGVEDMIYFKNPNY